MLRVFITHLKRRAFCLRLKHLDGDVPPLPPCPDDQPIRSLPDYLKSFWSKTLYTSFKKFFIEHVKFSKYIGMRLL